MHLALTRQGQDKELCCEGGEVGFVQRFILESAKVGGAWGGRKIGGEIHKAIFSPLSKQKKMDILKEHQLVRFCFQTSFRLWMWYDAELWGELQNAMCLVLQPAVEAGWWCWPNFLFIFRIKMTYSSNDEYIS